ncbi:unknown [Firmicutes bacterium CAG:475]|nr:unknown [Firmicutes bacterium CAG:475]
MSVDDHKRIVVVISVCDFDREGKSIADIADLIVLFELVGSRPAGHISYRFEMLVVIVNLKIFRVGGGDIRRGVFAIPIVFGQIVGEFDCSFASVKVCIGVAQTCKNESELHRTQSVGNTLRTVGFGVECARRVVKVVVARRCENLKVGVFAMQISDGVLQISQSVCNVHKCGDLAVFAEVARCKDVCRRNAFLCVFDECFDLLFEDHSAFHNEFRVACHGIVEVACFVVGAVDVLIAIIDGEVVNIAELTDFKFIHRRFCSIGRCNARNRERHDACKHDCERNDENQRQMLLHFVAHISSLCARGRANRSLLYDCTLKYN